VETVPTSLTALASLPDLLRLLAVPVLGWAAYRDIQTRRVPNRTWLPLGVLGLVLLAVDLWGVVPPATFTDRLVLLRTTISLGFVAPLAYLFWRLGGFGGADAKALIVLAVLFPTFPTYFLPGVALPVVVPTLGVFSMTILTNTVVLGLAYPLGVALRNVLRRDVAPVMLLGHRSQVADLAEAHGRLMETTEGYTRSGLDLDALRMYLRWRGTTLADLRADPATHRDPATVGETYDPTDGAVNAVSDPRAVTPAQSGGRSADDADTRSSNGPDADDPWAAERFLQEIEGSAYGTNPETLREGLAVVTERESVWVSPGIPFVVPMFLGLVAALTYGDLLVGLLGSLGLL
jgi:preflagellin peptidase FlaK